MPSSDYPFYIIWTGALNLGDTPGVFNDAAFTGLIVQMPITITFVPSGTDAVVIALTTTDVEVFNGKKHPVFFDWKAGDPLPSPVGHIDDAELFPGRPEVHLLNIPKNDATVDRHTLTIVVNPDIPAGFRDDFVLKRIEAHETVGVKFGW
jgi:hypothetical protein